MNLRQIRRQLTLVYAAMSAIAIGAMAIVAIRSGTARIFDNTERGAEQKVVDITPDVVLGNDVDEENAWRVVVSPGEDPQPQALGDTSLEPPVVTLALLALDSAAPVFDRLDQDGAYLAYAKPISGSEVIVAAVSLDEAEGDARSLRLKMWLAALVAIGGAAAVGYLIAGRSLGPARRAMLQQRDFLADAAHELRTPLAVIQASASYALSRTRKYPEYVESLTEILQAASAAGTGVAELLDYARLDAGQAQPRLAPLRLDLLVEEVAQSIRVEGCIVEAEVGAPVVVDADLALVRQAIDNVARNGAKRATRVVLSTGLAAGAKEAVVTIADDGPGFDPVILPHVFERFRRGDERGGSGLGLAIVRTIVAVHGGRCEARNGTEGGAVVKLHLPLSRANRH